MTTEAIAEHFPECNSRCEGEFHYLLPDRVPWTDVTFAGVYHDDPERVNELLRLMRPWFTHMVVGVQTNEPETDPTLCIARNWADKVILDRVAGFGDASIQRVLDEIETDWVFLISADEMPNDELLGSFQALADQVISEGREGAWIHFGNVIDGIDADSWKDVNHLRFFARRVGWPATLHSRPMTGNTLFWPVGTIWHVRSLDEMCRNYLTYLERGRGNPEWTAHNLMMMGSACEFVAEHKGWEYVKAFPWWPDVAAATGLEV